MDEFIPFFKSFWCKIASAARNWINSFPQTAATAFAVSSMMLYCDGCLPTRSNLHDFRLYKTGLCAALADMVSRVVPRWLGRRFPLGVPQRAVRSAFSASAARKSAPTAKKSWVSKIFDIFSFQKHILSFLGATKKDFCYLLCVVEELLFLNFF